MSTINIDKREVPATARNKRIYPGTGTSSSSSSSSGGGAIPDVTKAYVDGSLGTRDTNWALSQTAQDISIEFNRAYDLKQDVSILANKNNITTLTSKLATTDTSLGKLDASVKDNVDGRVFFMQNSSLNMSKFKYVGSLLEPSIGTNALNDASFGSTFVWSEGIVNVADYVSKTYVDGSISTYTGAISAKLVKTDASLLTLTGRHNITEASLGSLNTTVGSLNTSLTTLTGRHNITEASLGSLNTTVGSLNTTVGSLNTSLTTLTGRHNITEASLGKLDASVKDTYDGKIAFVQNSSLNMSKFKYVGGLLEPSVNTGGGVGTVGGSGTTNYIPKFISNTSIGNSSITDNGTLITTPALTSTGTVTAAGFTMSNGWTMWHSENLFTTIWGWADKPAGSGTQGLIAENNGNFAGGGLYWDTVNSELYFRTNNGGASPFTPFKKLWNSTNLASPIQGSGTVNYIPKFTGTGSIGNSIMYESGTTVTMPNLVTNNVVANSGVWAYSVGTQGDDLSLTLNGWSGSIVIGETKIVYDNGNMDDGHVFNQMIYAPGGNSTIWNATNASINDTFDLTKYEICAKMASPVATSGTGETKLFNMAIPANSALAGSTYRITMKGTSSSTGTLIFRVRVGQYGNTSDNQVWISTTSAAQVANTHAGFDVLVTVRSTTTAIADGMAHAGAVLLPTLIGAATTAAISTTAQWYIDVDCTCSVGTFTAQVCSIKEVK